MRRCYNNSIMDTKKSELLAQVFGAYPEILAAYVFGSRAIGKKHPESDLDLAVLPRYDQIQTRKPDILADLVHYVSMRSTWCSWTRMTSF